MKKSNFTSAPDICSADGRTFERAVQSFHMRCQNQQADTVASEVAHLLTALGAAQALVATEKNRRARILLQKLGLPEPLLRQLAASASQWRPEIKSALTSYLPAHLRRLVYTSLSGTAPADPQAPLTMSGTADASIHEPPVAPRSQPRRRTVLLLGTREEHENNMRLLDHRDFDPLRVDGLQRLHDLLAEDVCGFVIARSWWTTVSNADHYACLHTILSHSSFAWMKLDDTGLNCSSPRNLCMEVRFEEPSAFQLTIGDSHTVTPSNIEDLHRASELLSAAGDVQLAPADIAEKEATVLLAATLKHVGGRHFDGEVQIETVRAAPVPGGRSLAKTVRIEPDDGGPPLIAKIDSPDRLADEMHRFRRFIEPWHSRLSPRIYFHSGIATILFAFIDQPGMPARAAPTLEDQMEQLLYNELVSQEMRRGPLENDLQLTLERAVQGLSRLNSQPCHDGGCESKAWLGLESLEAMIGRGIQWHIATRVKNQNGLEVRNAALEIARRLIGPATAHGDIHLRNVLVRDDREPFLIDYACSGPAHPCFDLVRLESAMMFQCFRSLTDEKRVADLVRVIAESDRDRTDVLGAFPDVSSSAGNRLAIHTAILCRDACLQLLARYDGNRTDYLAVRLIVALQSLTMLQMQAATVRATVAALAELLAERINC